MKIRINRETYYNNPCPKITKELWDGFYSSLYHSFRKHNHNDVKKIESIDIRINQAYSGCRTIHFYVVINSGLSNAFEFHMSSDYFDMNNYGYGKQHKRYMWMVDFIRLGEIDLGTTKPMERYGKYVDIQRLKSKTRDKVKRLVSDYKNYIRLKTIFG